MELGRGKAIKQLYGEKIAIAGFARDAGPVLSFLKNSAEHQGAEIWVLDKNEKLELPKGVHARLGKDYLANLSDFDLVFRTPGIPYNLPEIQHALEQDVKISSATKLFFEEARKLPSKPLIVGITGTKGKGTTSTLLYNILRAAKRNVFLGGNIGVSALELLPELAALPARAKPIVILELSSFQLQDLKAPPDIAAMLEVFPDHQDSHKDLREYYSAKANIARYQTPAQKIFFFKNQAMSARLARWGRGKKKAVDEKKFRWFKPEELLTPGYHNFKNAAMAASIARELKVSKKIIIDTVKKFRGTEHRLEFVRSLGLIDFYNDSASTNPQTTAAAVLAFPGVPKVLLVGGQDKNLDYAPLAKALKSSGTAGVVLYGENKKKIAEAIKNSGVPIAEKETLADALHAARTAAEVFTVKSAVILSPGATSFDQFRDYKARGEEFKALVQSLK